MPENIKKLFSKFIVPEPKGDLLFKIMKRVEREKIRRLKFGLFFYSLITIISAVIFVWSFRWTGESLIKSGFGQFFSLLFSDFSVVKIYWQNFALALLEAMPLTGLIFILSTFLTLILSLYKLIKDIKQTLHLNYKSYGN